MTGAALATVALGSAAQVALYLHRFGASHRTDGFIAAFAVYSLVVVVAQILRTTAIPLLSGSKPRLDGAAFAWAMVGLGALTAIAGVWLASPLAAALSGASRAAQAVATASLRVMAPAAGLQLVGAALAVRGALEGRLVAVAIAFMASATGGLLAFFPLSALANERVLAFTTLIASALLVAGLLVATGAPSWHTARPAAVIRAALSVLRTIPLPASFVAMYPIALALAPSAGPGEITMFGLAFTACSYLAGFTGQGLSMVDAVEFAAMDKEATAQRRALVSRAFRYSLLAAAAGFGVAVVLGAPVVHLLIASRTGGSHSSFGDEVLLLGPWTIATLGLWALLPAVLARVDSQMERRLALGSLGLITIHVCAVLVASAAAGFDGLVLAMAVAPTVFVVIAVRAVVPGVGWSFLRDAGTVAASVAVAYGLGYLAARALFGDGLTAGIAAALAGTIGYVAIVAIVFPKSARTVARLVGRSPGPVTS